MLEQFDLPTHPVTGMTAIGIGNRGPIWPVLGASPEEDDGNEGEEGQSEESGESQEDEDKPLGAAGQKAYEAEKLKRKEAIAARREAEARAADLQAEIDRLKNGTADDDAEKARAKAVQDAVATATQKANDRILRSEIKAAATGKLANPALALKLLDLTQFEVDDDGNVDAEEVNDAIVDLLKKEPYLAAQGRRFQGDPDAGPRGKAEGTKPAQVTEDQIKTMSPEEIVKAQKEGRLADLLGG